jgi:ribonuclease HII
MIILGTDEAGRGPVIGPMVMSGILVDEKDKDFLRQIGVKDSKLLSPKKRREIFSILKERFKYKLIIVSPREIDEALNSEAMNLNKLEAVKTAMIINELNPDKAIIDCPSVNIESYKNYLKIYLKNKQLPIIVEHKADLNHVEAAAASILAKVTRDQEIEKIKKKIGIDFGSGYPSDPKTIEFLESNFSKFPGIFRTTWETYKKVKVNNNQERLI